jgi:hypothetical protein
MSLKLRRPRDHRAAPGNPDDWDVLDGEGAIGRIFRSSSAPQDRPWMWTITGAVIAPRLPSHGFAATLDEAKTAFAQTWRQWLALQPRCYDLPNPAALTIIPHCDTGPSRRCIRSGGASYVLRLPPDSDYQADIPDR